jgi:hypothetical protein
MSRLFVLLPLALTIGGCALEPLTPVEAPDQGPVAVAEPVVERQLTVASEEAPPPPPPTTMPALVPPRDPVPFRIGAGYGALARVDFSGCRDRGLPSGYLRLRATFNRVGSVVHASVESRDEPPPAALDCIADELRQTGVPAFDGGDVRLSKTYFVAAAQAQPAPPPAPPPVAPSAGD